MKLRTREYAVAVAKRSGKDIYNIKEIEFFKIPNGFGFWAADPFPIEYKGNLYIFAEIFEHIKGKGAIGYTKLENDRFTPWKIVVEENYHLSFPNILYYGDSLYMCPESYQSGKIYLYKCTEFPTKWAKDRTLVFDGNYVDTIFYKQDSENYGFTCLRDRSTPEYPIFKVFKVNNQGCEFSIGRVDTLESYMTRPAGKILYSEKDGADIMVSQICKPMYGSGIIFKKFDLDWPNYKEEEIFRVFPNEIYCNDKKSYVGLHTFNMTENYFVIDLIWNRFSASERLFSLQRKVLGALFQKKS